jgi:putative (di)nucleoside polyphosphate hydrolase
MDSNYRLGIGIVLVNPHNKVLLGKRIGMECSWQMPQGGVDDGEVLIDTVHREALEEIGTTNFKIIYESKDFYTYDIPMEYRSAFFKNKYIGQKQKWFLAKFLGEDSEININTNDPEFSDWKWSHIDDILPLAVYFKKQMYIDIFSEFNAILKK